MTNCIIKNAIVTLSVAGLIFLAVLVILTPNKDKYKTVSAIPMSDRRGGRGCRRSFDLVEIDHSRSPPSYPKSLIDGWSYQNYWTINYPNRSIDAESCIPYLQ